jgi:bifunctional UDP-N-acetylglucosamine pyrophosphorylase / glucosamine-1-phosphate N-acetyltransferase
MRRAVSPRRIVVVDGHGGDRVREALGAPDVHFVRQDPQLGTGHAVQQATPHLSAATTLVLYADVPLIDPATLRRLVSTGNPLALLTIEADDPAGYGRIVRDKAGRVARIVEEKDASAHEKRIREISTGLIAASTEKLKRWLGRIGNDNAQREYYLTDIVGLAVEEHASVATVAPGAYFEVLGVNSKPQLARLERILQWEQAQALMAQGVTLADPARIDIRGTLTCGRDVFIDVGCVFEGSVVLGDRVSIGANCVVRHAHVGPDSTVLPYTHIDDAIAGEGCRIGPYARLRPGTRLGNRVHVGNFVEVKATTVGDGSKANHLAYVGDASIGRNVNVGAGTITCNYDGANKLRTVIEDDVFIGSDSQLVAPVTLGRGSTIGAGSTITRDTPPDALTLSRSKQLTVPGWKRPRKNRV